jgi:hypothetical protein
MVLGLFDPRSIKVNSLRSEAQKDIVRGAKVEGQLQDEGARNNKRDGRCVRKRNKGETKRDRKEDRHTTSDSARGGYICEVRAASRRARARSVSAAGCPRGAG